MNCPNCKKDLLLLDGNIPFLNVDTYDNTVIAVTDCCGVAVRIAPVRSYNITTYQGPRMVDDWGNEFAPAELAATQD
jgi:hypothetical protein